MNGWEFFLGGGVLSECCLETSCCHLQPVKDQQRDRVDSFSSIGSSFFDFDMQVPLFEDEATNNGVGQGLPPPIESNNNIDDLRTITELGLLVKWDSDPNERFKFLEVHALGFVEKQAFLTVPAFVTVDVGFDQTVLRVFSGLHADKLFLVPKDLVFGKFSNQDIWQTALLFLALTFFRLRWLFKNSVHQGVLDSGFPELDDAPFIKKGNVHLHNAAYEAAQQLFIVSCQQTQLG